MSLGIARSLWRKALVTIVTATAFVSLYEVTFLDSQNAARQAALRETTGRPSPGAKLVFTASAYCKGDTTTSGVAAQRGVAAADPALLPVGSVVELATEGGNYNGIYTVMDTGPSVHGREVDLYMWSCNEALAFGRRPVHIIVLRLGWNPRATTRSVLERFFSRAS
jgi:3D (Asp-Asp-Asp) domain-containing protein